MSFSFVDQMSENVQFNLCYPYHLSREKMKNPAVMPQAFPDALHTHSFEALLKHAYREPLAFYLTEEDMKAYSNQELELILRVIIREKSHIENGFCTVDIDIDDEAMQYLMAYKNKHNITFEEAIISIFNKITDVVP